VGVSSTLMRCCVDRDCVSRFHHAMTSREAGKTEIKRLRASVVCAWNAVRRRGIFNCLQLIDHSLKRCGLPRAADAVVQLKSPRCLRLHVRRLVVFSTRLSSTKRTRKRISWRGKSTGKSHRLTLTSETCRLGSFS
jgi:hypothetical protein